MKTNAEAICGTSASPLAKTPFGGRMTTKETIHYAHLFSLPESGEIEVPFALTKTSLLTCGSDLKIRTKDQSTIITLPDTVATVFRLE